MSTRLASSSSSTDNQRDFIVNPKQRDATYEENKNNNSNNSNNMAQYLLDLHNAKATFDFCGGMMFQLVLTPALQAHLEAVAAAAATTTSENTQQQQQQQQPVLHDASKMRMHQLDTYQKSSFADNVQYFHGRELRNVPHANGGMGMVLQLSLAPSYQINDGTYTPGVRIDPQGWSVQEMQTYDGWGSDRGRQWRTAVDYEAEGFDNFVQTHGSRAFGLNHRFYLHKDRQGALWLAAEDGCEGTPAKTNANPNPVQSLIKQFL